MKVSIQQRKWAYFLFVAGAMCSILLFGIVLCNSNSDPTTPKTKMTNSVEQQQQYQLDFIRNMTRTAWNAFMEIAYQNDPFTWVNYRDYTHALEQSLSTLWVTNLRAEFAQGKQQLNIERKKKNENSFHRFRDFIEVAETVAEKIGSMLSCYALTGDEWFRDEAQEVANVLSPAYETKGLPYRHVILKDTDYYSYLNYYVHSLAQLGGSQHLEYRYLADLTKDASINSRVLKISSILRTISKPCGLYMTELNYEPPHWSTMKTSLVSSSAFYSYLLKSYIQSNFTDFESNSMFNAAIDAIEAAGMIVKSNQTLNGFTIVRDYNVRRKSYDKIQELKDDVCNLGALFGLSAWSLKNTAQDDARQRKHLDWAEQLTEMCHYVGNKTVTGFVPRWFVFEPNGNIIHDGLGDVVPYLAESYFVLYRLTKNPMYRQYAWQLVQSINTYSRRNSSGLFDRSIHVDRDNQPDWHSLDMQASDFIGSTLKYLYLTFTDDDVLPLDQWVFNRAGQPLPILGRNPMYPEYIGCWSNSETTTSTTTITKVISNITQMDQRLELIKNMTREVWIQQKSDIQSPKKAKALNMVQMLSSLWLMGLREEYEDGKRWVKENSKDFEKLKANSVVSTEYMGSLLSCFALTNDSVWLDRAKLVASKLKRQLDVCMYESTGLPNIYRHSKSDEVNLTEVGGQHLEFMYLADLTNDLVMKAKVHKARLFLQSTLTPFTINSCTPSFYHTSMNNFWPENMFYQYLAKSYLQSNGRDSRAIRLYKQAMTRLDALLQKSAKDGLTYARYYVRCGILCSRKDVKNHTNYESCYLGGMLALGAAAMERDLAMKQPTINLQDLKQQIEQHWTLAREITESCHNASSKTQTKLPQYIEVLDENYEDNRFDNDYRLTFKSTAAYAESYFVLWRLTHEAKYRDYAWEMAQAIHKHCRTDEGEYYHLTDVEQEYSRNNYEKPQDLNFLATALKYLYLTFSEDTLLPLNRWVFNRVGQPLPVCGKNPAYPAEKCESSTNQPPNSTTTNDPKMTERLALIKDMTMEAFWQQISVKFYKYDMYVELKNKMTMKSLSIAQMLSNLWVMGLVEEYEFGKEWLKMVYNSEDYTYEYRPEASPVTSAKWMGSLLSCYALTNDTEMLDWAKQIGDKLMDKLDTSILTNVWKFLTKKWFYDQPDKTDVHLAEVGEQHLEFIYLADMTDNLDMKTKVSKARAFLQNVKKSNNSLYMQDQGYLDLSSTFGTEKSFETTAVYAEICFVQWRLTHQTKYRDYAWELTQKIYKHCRTEEGMYYKLTDANQEYSRNTKNNPKLNFLSITLKYLYLTFSEDTLLPLDQWVFNRVGQPLPVCGKNPAYPTEKCTTVKCPYYVPHFIRNLL